MGMKSAAKWGGHRALGPSISKGKHMLWFILFEAEGQVVAARKSPTPKIESMGVDTK